MELERLVFFIDTLEDSTVMSIHQRQCLLNTSSTTRLSRIKGFSSVSLILLVKKDSDQWPDRTIGDVTTILAYDVSNKGSFIDLSMWLVGVDACCDPVVKVLVATKLTKTMKGKSLEKKENHLLDNIFLTFSWRLRLKLEIKWKMSFLTSQSLSSRCRKEM